MDRDVISPTLSRDMILDPEKRSTALTMAIVLKYCREKLGYDSWEVLFISPSDHVMSSQSKFIEGVRRAKEIARKGYIVAFGIKSTGQHTGLGENTPSSKRATGTKSSGSW